MATYYVHTAPRVQGLYRVIQVLWFFLGILEALLAFRLALRLLAANPNAVFTDIIYSITAPFVAPFVAVFSPTFVTSGSVFEWTTLLAMLVYLFIISAIVRLMAMGRPVTNTEAEARLIEEDNS